MRKIYLAAFFSRREEMADLGGKLQSDGHAIASTWIWPDSEEGMSREQIAVQDVEDLRKADTLILFTMPRGGLYPGGGRFTEFGIAYERGIDCIIVGEREQVFCCLPEVRQFDNFEAAREAIRLRKIAGRRNQGEAT